MTAARVAAFASSLALVWLGVRTWRRWETPTARTFAGLLGTAGLSALGVAVTAGDPSAYQVVWLYGYLAIPTALAVFAFDYYGLDTFTSRSGRMAFAVPSVAAAVAGTVLAELPDTAARMGSLPGPSMALPSPAVAGLIALREIGLYYASGATLVAVGLIGLAVVRYDHIEPGLGLTLAFVGGWPWVSFLTVSAVTRIEGYGVGIATIAGCYVASVGAVGVASRRYELFESLPAAGTVGPETALHALEDPVLVVNDADTILRVNAAACEMFGGTVDEAIGKRIETALGVSAETLAEREVVEIDTVAGRRQFEATVSPVGRRRGAAIVLRDVTQRRTREQRLTVLNRVLRHNLRNDLNVIRGHASLVSDGGDPQRAADHIRSAADELVSLGERAREVEKMMRESGTSDAAVDEVLAEVVEAFATEWPAVSFTCAVPDGLRAAVDPEVLRLVTRNLLDNACVHNDAAEPLVVVTADRTDDGVRVAVSDNGPGIPESERSVIEAGRETQISHGSGLGLWAVRWGVTRMGGRLSFADNDPRGTVVEMELPAVETPPSPVEGAAETVETAAVAESNSDD